MKIKKIGAMSFAVVSLMSIATETGVSVYATENTISEPNIDNTAVIDSTFTEDETDSTNNCIFQSDDVIIENTESGIEVTKYETSDSSDISPRVNVYRWGSLQYTHIALTTGVVAGAVNTAFAFGLGTVIGTFGIPTWAISALLTGAGWTHLGSAPGNAVADKWDTNNNGWVGFYFKTGYDAKGNAVATKYSTK